MTALTQRLGRIQRAVERLEVDVRALRGQLTPAGMESVRAALRRRGLVLKNVLHDGCLAPSAPGAQEEFYHLLQHYSFRLFLRDVIKQRDGFSVTDLVRYCSLPTARRYLRWLVTQKLVARCGARFRLRPEVTSFGPTLEWFVATVLEREYGIPTAWNVRLEAAAGGGDYDVIGFQEGSCVYIETKSSPPRNIEARQVQAFCDRLETLRPDFAVFLNDTQLRMADKVVLLFDDELRRRLRRRARAVRVEHLTGELFTVGERLCIANSDPDLSGNLGTCLAQHFRRHGVRLQGGGA